VRQRTLLHVGDDLFGDRVRGGFLGLDRGEGLSVNTAW
jgi:hypothetical protein